MNGLNKKEKEIKEMSEEIKRERKQQWRESIMKQILLKDILGILGNNQTIYLYESPKLLIGSFRVDRLLAYFSDIKQRSAAY